MAEIKVKELPVIKHRSPFFRDGFLSMVIIGKSGCGKTRMLASILPGISESIKTVLVATVIKDVPLHKAIVDYFRGKGIRSGTANTPEDISGAVKMLEENDEVNLERQGLIIFDDFNTGKATGPYWEFVIHAFSKLRNSGWNFIILSQQPSFVPTIVRNCTTSRVLFDCYTKSALSTFTRDVADRLADRGAYNLLLRYIQEVPYTYILVQEHPFEISAGTLNKFKVVMSKSQVQIPTLREIEKELGVTSINQLDEKTKKLQIKAGNTSSMLQEPSYLSAWLQQTEGKKNSED